MVHSWHTSLLLMAFGLGSLAGSTQAQATVDQYDGGGDGFGQRVSAAGDVNNDGYDDVLVGIPLDDPGDLVRAGSVTVYSGLDGSILYDASDFAFRGFSEEDRFGAALACAGRVDMDNHDDLVIAGGGPLSTVRYVRVISGATGSIIYQFSGSVAGGFGYSVDGAGDVDGDGRDDVIIGAPFTNGNRGSVQVRSGATGATIWPINAALPGSFFGHSVSGGGDADGDMHADFAAGAPQFGSGGPGYVVALSGFTGTGIRSLVGSEIDGEFGSAVNLERDVDGDGLADLVVSSPREDAPGRVDAGYVRVFSLATGSQIWDWHGLGTGDGFGLSIGVADADDDGFADVIVGAPGDDTAIFDAGSVSVFSGYGGHPLYRVYGTLVRETFGWSVAGAGFVNDHPIATPGNDAVEDVAIGSPGGNTVGFCRILTGAPPVIQFVPPTVTLHPAGVFNPLTADPRTGDGWSWRFRRLPLTVPSQSKIRRP